MNTSELKLVLEELVRAPRNFPFWAYFWVFVVSCLGSWLGAYLKKKGENLATREDVAKLTALVENVRGQYAEKLENLAHANRKVLEAGTREHQLRLAAIEQRLQKHQQAFALWRKLVASTHGPEITDSVSECQKWWNENCLYLEAEARKAFVQAYTAAHIHRELLSHGTPSDEVMKNWDLIVRAGNAITTGVELPPINVLEMEKTLVATLAKESGSSNKLAEVGPP